MTYSATVTSKRQVTIPVEMFKKMNLKKGHKIIFSENNGIYKMESAIDQVNRLAGSLTLPKKFQGMNLDDLILQAKQEHFANKKI